MPTGIGGELGWWCPSLDDAGNGTGTVNDFGSGANNGSLVGSAAWVADTGSGGVRAIQCGTNDEVDCTAAAAALLDGLQEISMSCWLYRDAANKAVNCGRFSSSNTSKFGWTWFSDGNLYIDLEGSFDTFSFGGTGWHHFAMLYDGLRTTDRVRVFADGVHLGDSSIGSSVLSAVVADLSMGRDQTTRWSDGRLDDFRIFGRYLNDTEVGDLASKRGYEPGGASPPVNTVAPVVTGNPVVNDVLSTTDGTWTGDPTPTYTYQWQRGDTPTGPWADPSGATNNNYTPVQADLGKYMRCQVTGTNSEGSSTANSNVVGPVTQHIQTGLLRKRALSLIPTHRSFKKG